MERECKDLDKTIEIYLDGKKIELPSIESIVILNIPSWAAGVNLWNIGLEGIRCRVPSTVGFLKENYCVLVTPFPEFKLIFVIIFSLTHFLISNRSRRIWSTKY